MSWIAEARLVGGPGDGRHLQVTVDFDRRPDKTLTLVESTSATVTQEHCYQLDPQPDRAGVWIYTHTGETPT